MSVNEHYVGRHAILGTDGQIFAYELLFRASINATSSGVNNDLTCTSAVLKSIFSSIGLENIVGSEKAFLNVNEEVILSDFIEIIPKDQVYLEILEHTHVDAAVVKRIKSLHAKGYQFVIDDFDGSETMIEQFKDVFEYVSMIKVDIPMVGTDKASLDKIAKTLSRFCPVWLAEKVENKEVYENCKALGFQYFQGYYFSKPDVFSEKSLNENSTSVVQIMNKILQKAPIDEIEGAFKESPEMMVALLKFINSAGTSTKVEVTSIKNAISLVGLRNLFRWLTILSYAQNNLPPSKNALLISAQFRAKIMEELVQTSDNKTLKNLTDESYICGLLSLIDVVFQSPMDIILSKLQLGEEIKTALIQNEGILHDLLELAITIERDEPSEIEKLLENTKVDIADLNRIKLETIQWVDELNRASEGG